MVKTITVMGIRAANIIAANHASFYGVLGGTPSTSAGLRCATAAIKDYLEENHIDWNGFNIMSTKTIDTSNTKIPYMAEITFCYD